MRRHQCTHTFCTYSHVPRARLVVPRRRSSRAPSPGQRHARRHARSGRRQRRGCAGGGGDEGVEEVAGQLGQQRGRGGDILLQRCMRAPGTERRSGATQSCLRCSRRRVPWSPSVMYVAVTDSANACAACGRTRERCGARALRHWPARPHRVAVLREPPAAVRVAQARRHNLALPATRRELRAATGAPAQRPRTCGFCSAPTPATRNS